MPPGAFSSFSGASNLHLQTPSRSGAGRNPVAISPTSGFETCTGNSSVLADGMQNYTKKVDTFSTTVTNSCGTKPLNTSCETSGSGLTCPVPGHEVMWCTLAQYCLNSPLGMGMNGGRTTVQRERTSTVPLDSRNIKTYGGKRSGMQHDDCFKLLDQFPGAGFHRSEVELPLPYGRRRQDPHGQSPRCSRTRFFASGRAPRTIPQRNVNTQLKYYKMTGL